MKFPRNDETLVKLQLVDTCKMSSCAVTEKNQRLPIIYLPTMESKTMTKSNTFQRCRKYPHRRAMIRNRASMMKIQVKMILKICDGRKWQSLIKENIVYLQLRNMIH